MGKKLKNMTDTNLLLTITIVVFFVMYIGAIVFQGKGFLKPQTFFNILNANAALIILSCGMSLVMITGGIDISVGGVVALVSMSCAVYLDFGGGNVFVSMLLAVAIGLAFGIVQGFLVAYLDIQPFIVTLAGMFFARGMTTIVNTKPFNVANESFTALKETRVIVPGMGSVNKLGNYVNAYVEIGVIVALLVVILMFIMLRWTKMGRSFYAVGGNNQSALMLGINVKRTKFMSHLLCGLLAGIGGSSCISVLESITANCMEIFHTSRKKTVLVLSVIYLAASAVIALGYSIFYVEVKLPNGSVGQLLDIMDYISNSVMMPFIALLSTILIGWVVTPDYVISEMERSGDKFRRKKLYRVMIRFVAPVMMFILFLQSTGILS